MALFTKGQVRNAAYRAASIPPLSFITEAALAQRAQARFQTLTEASQISAKDTFDIFLSHSYADYTTVLGVYSILHERGFKVYVDWIYDRELDRKNITHSTAEILRKRMRQSSSLFFVTSENSTNSKWMPWECGYFDGYDSNVIDNKVQHGHVAILPVVETQAFIGQEYLGLYPLAEDSVYPYPRNIDICNQRDRSKRLKFDYWIRNGHP